MRILIVDDRKEGLNLLETLLGRGGHEVESAPNGAVALDKLRTGRFDLIISDILMPVMDGFQLCKKTKSEEGLRNIPFIFYTATYTGPKDEEFAIRIGADRFIRKPCDQGEFLKAIGEVLDTAGRKESPVSAVTSLHPEEILQLYSERLVRKLEQKAIEAEAAARTLQAEKMKFQALADELPLGLVLIGADGSCRYLNPRFTDLFGYSQADWPAIKTWIENISPEPLSPQNKIAPGQGEKETVNSSIPHPWTARLNGRDGSEKQVRTQSAFLANGDQLLTFEDFSEQVRLETKLRQVQKMEAIATLAGGIAHDFNNILTGVMGYAELAKAEVPKASLMEKYVSGILNAAQRAKHLVGQILAFSRKTEQGRIPLALHLVVEEVISFLGSTLPANIEIKSQIDRKGMVLADSTQIHQVLMNLCTNSFHSMRGKGGILQVELKKVTLNMAEAAHFPGLNPGNYLKLTVKDSGCGMPPEVIARIFDPYFTTKTEGEGTGLGLSVSHGIVKNHLGAIDVTSTLGVGTTFQVYLPSLEKFSDQILQPDQTPFPRGNERILFVDDEPAITLLGSEIMERLGYKVAARNNPIDALELFQKDPQGFDLVIIDMIMPRMTGVDLGIELRRLRPDLPLILCSGTGLPNAEKKTAGGEFRGFLKKPFTSRELAVLVRRTLDGEKKDLQS